MIEGQIHPHCYNIEETTLLDLAGFFKEKILHGCSSVDWKSGYEMQEGGYTCAEAALGLGREEMPMELIRDMDIDVVVCGEITEWTLCAYINDAKMLGFNKGMIILGH